ncbi:Smr/MutS family protein [Candidatus Sumerlaeota bacterium]|nr:Smr/MutS family protein [Candidatus Sumerlaeota bacterium]
MDRTTFNCLEFPAVLEHLAALAECAAAKDAIRETRPWVDPDTIRRHSDAVQELLDLLDSGGSVSIGGFDDCGELLARLALPDGVLDGLEWMALRRFLEIAASVRAGLQARRERMPVAWERVETIDPLPDLAREIGRVFDADGQVRDSASEDLKSCRSALRRLEKEIERVFNRILEKMQGSDVLQELYWTTRSGRRVAPVRAGARGRFQGIVHDTSNSGETLFMEPLEAVEPTNRLAAEQNREREEIARILARLSARAREDIGALQANREALVQVDLWHARARLAYKHALHRPLVAAGEKLVLIETHHPLLYLRDPKKSVPLDMRLEPENRVLVITGPNTGGKTTALKTVGLVSLMAQSAIPIPAGVDSRLPVFVQVLAEIGDEQSVSAGLSTFSAHIRRISRILETCAGDALVLLDELGKATDPLQAGALGRAILEALVARGALTLVSTHLATLKDWAHDSAAGRNASFRLDPRTHRPMYQLHLDTPGISEAFTIALAEGLPREIVEAAVEGLPKEERELSELLSTLHDREAKLETALRRSRAARKKADGERRELRRVRAELEANRSRMNKDLEERYKDLLDNARRDIEKRIANLPSRHAISQARDQLARDQRAAEERIRAIQEKERRILEKAEPPRVEKGAPYEPTEGDWVYIGQGDAIGRIAQIDSARGRAKVSMGTLSVDAALQDLRSAPPQPEALDEFLSGPRYTVGGPVHSVPSEIDLHGWRVADAIDRADKYLDEAMLSHLTQVRVVHGTGTGALRSALHDLFRHHPHVRAFRLADPRDGGPSVTLVTLR